MNKFKFQADVIGELHPLFKGLQWVCAARSTDDDRFVLNLIQVERDGMMVKIVATDGRRLHVHTFDPGMFDDDIQMIEPGLYEVIAKSGKLVVIAEPESDHNYPNWRQVVPDHLTTESDLVTSATIGKIGIRTGVLLATDFMLDAIGFKHGRGKDESVSITYGPGPVKTGAFLIEHDLGTAVIMPLRMEDAEKGEVEATPFMAGMPAPEGKVPKKEDPEEETPSMPLDILKDAMAPGDRLTVSIDGKMASEFAKDTSIPLGERMRTLMDAGDNVMISDEYEDDGPRIVDVDEEEFKTNQLLIDLEKTPKLRRRKALLAMLEDHGAAQIQAFDEYRTWVGADLHLAKVIQEVINSLPADAELGESQPEGSSDDY